MTACAPLSKHDSVMGDIGEVAGRALLCPLTLCISEMEFARQWKEQEQQARYGQWYHSLTPEQQAREDQRAHERQLGAMQALGMINQGRGILGPSYTPPPVRPYDFSVPTYQRRGTNCTSNVVGTQVYTNCY